MSMLSVADDVASLTVADVEKMSYNELIGLVRETNRPPGGSRVLQAIARQLFLSPSRHVLEIGCATGWTSIELASLTGCQVTAIDLNPASISEARRRLAETSVDSVTFKVANALDIPVADASVDVVFCGNVTSLISDAGRAMAEYVRILKEGGALVAIPMYYVRPPSETLVDNVRRAIQVNIPVNYRQDAIDPFANLALRIDETIDFTFDDVDAGDVDAFCDEILSREHLKELPSETYKRLCDIYRYQMHLFRDNLSHMGFSVLIFRKPRKNDERELFSVTQVK